MVSALVKEFTEWPAKQSNAWIVGTTAGRPFGMNERKVMNGRKEGEYECVSFSDSCPIPLLVQTDLTIFNIVWMQWNIFDQIHLFLTMLKARFDIIICPPIYLYLIFTIFEFEIIPVWWTRFLVYFKLEFYRLQPTEKCSSSNLIFQSGELEKFSLDR